MGPKIEYTGVLDPSKLVANNQEIGGLTAASGAHSEGKGRNQGNQDRVFVANNNLAGAVDGATTPEGERSAFFAQQKMLTTNSDPSLSGLSAKDRAMAVFAAGQKAVAEQMKQINASPERALASGAIVMLGPSDTKTGTREAHAVWAGNCRVYVLRNGNLYQVTADHDSLYATLGGKVGQARWFQSVIAQQRDPQNLDTSYQPRFQSRKQLARSMGDGQPPSHHQFAVDANDLVLVVTDGVHHNLSDPEILAILKQEQAKGPEEIAKALAKAANKASGQRDNPRRSVDDASAAVMKIEPLAKKDSLATRPISKGTMVGVKSPQSGGVDYGWFYAGHHPDTGEIMVVSPRGMLRTTFEALVADPNGQAINQPPSIAHARSFPELFALLEHRQQTNAPIKGNSGAYSGHRLMPLIASFIAFGREEDLNAITSGEGLRETVKSLRNAWVDTSKSTPPQPRKSFRERAKDAYQALSQ